MMHSFEMEKINGEIKKAQGEIHNVKIGKTRKGSVLRTIMSETDKMKDMYEEILYTRLKNEREKGILIGVAAKIDGYKVEVSERSIKLFKDSEMIIDKAIRMRTIVKLPEWAIMRIPIQIVFNMSGDCEKVESILVRKRDKEYLALFHVNSNSCCLGGQKLPRTDISKESLEELEKWFLDLMRIVNANSTFQLNEELIDMKNYIYYKYLEVDNNERVIERLKRLLKTEGNKEDIEVINRQIAEKTEELEEIEKIAEELKGKVMKNCPYIKKEEEAKENVEI